MMSGECERCGEHTMDCICHMPVDDMIDSLIYSIIRHTKKEKSTEILNYARDLYCIVRAIDETEIE